MELQEMKEKMIGWMGQMKHGYRDSNLYLCEEENSTGEKEIRMILFTEKNNYSIVASNSSKHGKGYLGAMASSRKPRAGEDWTRGNDLADGYFSEETWINIIGDIVGYELVKIHRPISNLYPIIIPL